jgi:hypothetical protein
MDIYTYVASSNPYQAKAILHKYGYSIRDVKDSKDLGVCLKSLVALEGEDAFNDIIENHPDRGLLFEVKEKSIGEQYANLDGSKKCNCNCSKNDAEYLNFIGSSASKSVKETSVYILAAALLLAAAIIVKR